MDLFTSRVEIHMDRRRIILVTERETLTILAGLIGSLQIAEQVAVNGNPATVSNICGRLADTVPWPKLAWCHRSRQNLFRIRNNVPSGTVVYTANARPIVDRMLKQWETYKALVKLGARAKTGDIVIDHTLKLPPYSHQLMMGSFIVVVGHAASLADCGVGKTYVTLWVTDLFKKKHGKVKALVVAPLSILEKAWGEDIEKFTDLRWTNLWAVRRHRRKAEAKTKLSDIQLDERIARLKDDDIDVYVVNYATVRNPKLLKALIAKKFDIVAVDEASLIKNAQSAIFKALFKISASATHRIPMSGTPAPNGVEDIWAPMHFVDRGGTLDYSFVDFREDFLQFKQMGREKGQGKWFPKTGAMKRLAPIISRRSIRVNLTDCVDMPELVEQIRLVNMTPEQARAYKSMKEQLFMELEGETLSVRNQLAKLLSLRQITGGFVYAGPLDDRRVISVTNNPKMAELDLVLEEAGAHRKVIVWSEFRSEIEHMVERYKARKPITLYGGSGTQRKRDAEFDRFRSDDDCTLCIAHPASAGYGLTMTHATLTVHYSISHRHDQDYQKTRRMWRNGQKFPCVAIKLACRRSIDLTCIAAITSKKAIEDALVPGSFNKSVYERITGGTT